MNIRRRVRREAAFTSGRFHSRANNERRKPNSANQNPTTIGVP